MGQFTNEIVRKQRKHKQRVNVPVVIDVADLDLIEDIVTAGPETFTGNVTDISESSGNATVAVSYEARGADKTDVTKRLDVGGIKFITKRPTTDRLCGCESGPCTED